jgi:pimeloyl-ACP methyl ester carboxylesterase
VVVETGSVELSGYTLAGLQWGQAESVKTICFHGWLDNAASFHQLAGQFIGNDAVDGMPDALIAVDLPGHGLSPWHAAGQGYPIWGYTHDLKAFLEQLSDSGHSGAAPVDIIAHSLGGSLALCLAAAFPEVVRSIVLLDSPGPMVTPENQWVDQLRKGVEARDKVRSSREFTQLSDAIEARRKATPKLSNQALSALVARNLKPVESGFQWCTDPQLKLDSQVKLTEGQVKVLMECVTCPVLSIRAADGLIPNTFFDHRMSYLPNVEVCELPGHHHFHMELESVGSIAEVIATWRKQQGFVR